MSDVERFDRAARDLLTAAQPTLLVPEQPPDVVAFVTVRLHQTGAVSTQGTIGDKAMALRLIDIARDAIVGRVSDTPIVVPGRDVGFAPSLPTRDLGSMARHERGDP